MKIITITTKGELRKELRKLGLTATPLPDLPVTIGDVTIKCSHARFTAPKTAGKGLTSWFDVCNTCGAMRKAWYSRYGLERGEWMK